MADLQPSSEAARENSGPEKVQESKLSVAQPLKMQELGQLLDTLDGLAQRVSERSNEDASGDLGGSGSVGGQTGQKRASSRDVAIALMPTAPVVLQQKLAEHIEQEVRKLERELRALKRVTKAGGAFEMNELYRRIRKLRSLLRELVEASVDLLKRLYIRVFVDKQSIL